MAFVLSERVKWRTSHGAPAYTVSKAQRGKINMAIKVYIDQGHNPNNPNAGAEAFGVKEQDITYEVGILLADLLRQSGNYEVRLARPTPTSSVGESNSESLRLRVEEANNWGADYYVSIHANTSGNPSVSGTEAFSYSEPSRAFTLGERILDGIAEETGLRNRGMKTRTNLYVLRRTRMPAVLVELAFMTNREDLDLMLERPDLFADGIYRGIVSYTGLD